LKTIHEARLIKNYINLSKFKAIKQLFLVINLFQFRMASTGLTGFTLAAAPPQATAAVTAPQTTTNQVSLTTTTLTTPSSSATTNQNTMNFYSLEEQINKWTLELEEQEKVFTNQATQVNAWDSILLKNGEKIVELNKAFEKVKADQVAMEQELEFITAQQAELEESIVPLEQELSKIPQQIDVDRSQTYLMAETLDSQLKQMSEDLKEVIEHLNEANKISDPSDPNPMVQIGKILNAHFTTLQWIDDKTLSINNRLDELSKISSTYQKDPSFRYE
jgi:nuclear pore complex protein Nup62